MKRALKRISDIWIAEATVLAVIAINAVAMLVSSLFECGTVSHSVCNNIDVACVVFFIIETLIKINRKGIHGYWKSNWNKFDFIIVLMSLPVFVEHFIEIQGFGVVLIFRLGRLFRLFRLLMFVPNIEHMVNGTVRALKASIGVFIALLLFNLIFAIGATILFGQIAPEYFGNPFLSIYSTFKVFTVEGWYDIPDLIAERANSDLLIVVVRSYFVIVVLVGGILGLSLANAVFVDEMTMDNTKELEDKIDKLITEMIEIKKSINSSTRSQDEQEHT